MPDFIIREAVTADAAAIAELGRDDLGYACTAETVSIRLSQCDAGRECIFVAEQDGATVGFIHAQIYQTLYFDPLINVLGLAVSETARRRGIGTALLDRAAQWGITVGAVGVRLNSGGMRTGAHAFYRRAGFSEEKVQLRFLKRL